MEPTNPEAEREGKGGSNEEETAYWLKGMTL
jgi:hypothetical protein